MGSPAESSTWECPACRYDMTGAPGPICPECGIDAVAERERLARRRRDVSPDWLLLGVLFPVLIVPVRAFDLRTKFHDADTFGACLAIATIMGVPWVWLTREKMMAQGRLWRLGLYVVLSLAGLGVMGAFDRPRADVDLVAVLGGWLVILSFTAATWTWTRGRVAWTLLGYTGSTIGIPGVLLTAASVSALAAGHHWSPFSDPRPGQVYDQYPLSWEEVRLVGPVLTAAGAVMVWKAARMRRRAL